MHDRARASYTLVTADRACPVGSAALRVIVWACQPGKVMGLLSRALHLGFSAATLGVAVWYSQLENQGTVEMAIYLFAGAIIGFLTVPWPARGRLGVMATFGTAHGLIGFTSPSDFGLLMLGTAVLAIAGTVATSRHTDGPEPHGLTAGRIIGVGTLIGVGVVATLLLTAN